MNNKIKEYLLMDKKNHYRIYKSGKQWLVAGIATMGFGLTLGLTNTTVSAAECDVSTVCIKPNIMDYITVEFVDKDTNATLSTFKPTGKHFGATLDLGKNYLEDSLNKRSEDPLCKAFKALKNAGYEYDENSNSRNYEVKYDDPDSTPKTVKVYVKKQIKMSQASIQIRYLTRGGKQIGSTRTVSLTCKVVGSEYSASREVRGNRPPKYAISASQPGGNNFIVIVPETGSVTITVYCERIK